MRKTHSRSFDLLSNYSHYPCTYGSLCVLAGWIVGGALLGNVVGLILMACCGQDFYMTYGNLIAYPLIFIPAMIYASARSTRDMFFGRGIALDSNHFSEGSFGTLKTVLAACAGFLGAIFISDIFTIILPQMPESLKSVMESLVGGPLWVSLVCVSVFAPFFEEWLCRGMILRGLLQKVKPVWAIIISALFFAAIHLNIWQAIPAFIMGCFMGYVYYRTGSLKLTMLLHCLNNTLSTVLARIDGLEDVETYYEIFPDKSLYWCTFAAAAMVVVLAIMHLRKVKLQGPEGNCDRIASIDEIESI